MEENEPDCAGSGAAAERRAGGARAVIVYRDLLLAPSEAFVPRMYGAFRRLRPVYLGARYGRARHLLGQDEAHRVADHVPGGWLGQQLFRHCGVVPGRLAAWARGTGAALVHAHFGRGGALALPLARALGLPLVVTFHGGDATKDKHYRDGPRLLRTIYQRRRRALADQAALILCVSDSVRRKLVERGFPPDRLRTHYLGVEVPERLERLPGHGSRRLLFVGRFVEKKGVDGLLMAAAALREAGSPVEVVLAGDGPLRPALERLAGELGVACRFTGWIEPAAVYREMADAHALVVPSRTAASGDAEGVPTVVYEAQARGLPVVATRHGGNPEVIEDARTGVLVPEHDPRGLADALRRLRADADLHRAIQAEARRSVAANFNAGRQSARLERILLGVAATAAAPRPRRGILGPGPTSWRAVVA